MTSQDLSTLQLLQVIFPKGDASADKVQDDVCGAHEGGCFQRAVRSQQDHVLEPMLGKESSGQLVIPCHHPQWVRLSPLWHGLEIIQRVDTCITGCESAKQILLETHKKLQGDGRRARAKAKLGEDQ